jgi:site-specific recombinase XerD
MSVKLHYKELPNGTKSAWLDIHHLGIRTRPSIGIILEKENTTGAKERNKGLKRMAEQIRTMKELELISEQYGIEQNTRSRFEDFYAIIVYEAEISVRKDKRGFLTIIKKLKEFSGKQILPCYEITIEFVERFKSHLEKTLSGETPYDYFKKFNYVLKKATKRGNFKVNPANDIRVKRGKAKIKDTLSTEEAQKLLRAHCPNEQVKRAFIFSLHSGLRYCDVKDIQWKHVKEGFISIVQSKTSDPVSIPMKEEILNFLGERQEPEAKIFKLPSHTACLKNLRSWTANAGISKKITWHCARHSFGTLLVANGADVLITSKLLGHKSLAHTLRYVRVVENQKREAIDKIPSIF